MRRHHGTVWAALLLALTTEGANAGEIGLVSSVGRPGVNPTSDAEARKFLLDRVLAGESSSPQYGDGLAGLDTADVSRVLREADAEDVRVAADESMELLANPEPSSLLVWAATTVGLLAAAYGYRHRQQPISAPV